MTRSVTLTSESRATNASTAALASCAPPRGAPTPSEARRSRRTAAPATLSGYNACSIVNANHKEGPCDVADLFVGDADESLPPERLEAVNRALRRAAALEVALLERYLPFLATTASAAPFIGLFGTVWGIMAAFHGIGQQGSASLAVVAPGISEALIATAAGLGAAIPAVIGYNYFVNRVKHWATEMDGFTLDLLNLLSRPAPKVAH